MQLYHKTTIPTNLADKYAYNDFLLFLKSWLIISTQKKWYLDISVYTGICHLLSNPLFKKFF